MLPISRCHIVNLDDVIANLTALGLLLWMYSWKRQDGLTTRIFLILIVSADNYETSSTKLVFKKIYSNRVIQCAQNGLSIISMLSIETDVNLNFNNVVENVFYR